MRVAPKFFHDHLTTAQRREASSVKYIHVSSQILTDLLGRPYTGRGSTYNVGATKRKDQRYFERCARRNAFRAAKQENV